MQLYDNRLLHTCIGHVVRKGACIKQANVGGVSCLLKHVCCHKMRKFMLMYYYKDSICSSLLLMLLLC